VALNRYPVPEWVPVRSAAWVHQQVNMHPYPTELMLHSRLWGQPATFVMGAGDQLPPLQVWLAARAARCSQACPPSLKTCGTGYMATKKIGPVATHRIPQMVDVHWRFFVYNGADNQSI
jgi:hypothetical protein